jgi:RND family efflux transporter MFP subunit
LVSAYFRVFPEALDEVIQVKFRRIFVVLLLVVACAGWILLRSKSTHADAEGESSAPTASTAVLVPVVKASRASISNQLVISAELRPFQEVDVHAKVAGYVKTIYVDVGDHVKANQVLAILEVPEIDAELKQAEAAIRQSRAEVNRLQSLVEQSESSHTAIHSNTTRLLQVVKDQPNLVAQQEVDDAVAKDKAAEAQVQSNKAGLVAAQEHLSVAEADRERVATLKSFARITAPFDGVVTKRYADTGAMVQAGTASNTQTMPVVRISENKKLRLSIPVPESAVPFIHLRAPVEVRVSALNRSFRGEIARFADSVDLQTRTMETEVDVDNTTGVLVPGMFASAVLITQNKDNVLSLPVEAISRSGNETKALVVGADNKLEERKLVLGVEDPSRVEVVSGVSPGEQVVLGIQNQLQPGQQVQPKLVQTSPQTNNKS